jgi:5'-nucleotidase
MRILLSNDDGVHAPGLHILYKELCKLGQVKVVAPLEEKSTTGHSLTLHKPLRLIPMGRDFFGVSGSPADCVYIGIKQVWKRMPDIVVSGINRGANLGQDVYYSGTVSAAREGCMLGIPSFAVSLHVDFGSKKKEAKLHYLTAAKNAAKIIRDFMKSQKMPKHTMLNINVPDIAASKVKGIRYARQGFRHYSGSVVKRTDHRGKDYFWVGGQYLGFEPEPNTDCTVVDQGFISVTPLKLDVTDMSFLAELDKGKAARKKR